MSQTERGKRGSSSCVRCPSTALAPRSAAVRRRWAELRQERPIGLGAPQAPWQREPIGLSTPEDPWQREPIGLGAPQAPWQREPIELGTPEDPWQREPIGLGPPQAPWRCELVGAWRRGVGKHA